MKILLVCAGGFSTTMMMGAIKKIIAKSEKLNSEDFEPMEAIPVDRLPEKIGEFDIVLVGPQLGHKYDYVQEVAKDYNKPSILLSAEIYGAMDGATVLKQALIAHKRYHG
ncbi:PTS sugar transporter subunit IIB [uncultured Cetobacterium sp.]|uniref:PTS sugar transporter subunit IIB n=1 Tax=uncultured Cetobacterium sp. TaxID=527638 RepID=UPI0025F710A1|nr:PTS sugar transporter subunit IIB [uncultured Cetobacterium sp.]